VPIQPPSDRTCARGEPPSPDFWLLTSGFSPIIRNEPNSRIPSVPPPHIYAKRTQFTVPPASCRPYSTPIRKTNPIPVRARPGAPGCPYRTKRTQFPPRQTCGEPKNAKRTQSQTINIRYAFYNIQSPCPNNRNRYPGYTISCQGLSPNSPFQTAHAFV